MTSLTIWPARSFVPNGWVVPSRQAWSRAAEIIAQLARDEGLDRRTLPAGFANDVLIAASCREHGLTLITENVRDFARIQNRMAFEYVVPWPSMG